MPEICFLNWDKPACELIAEKLLSEAGEKPLYNYGIIVPTKESGRQLRRQLVSQASNKAMLTPNISTVYQFIVPDEGAGTMTVLEELSCWVEVLNEEPLQSAYPNLFPKKLQSDTASLMSIAVDMRSLRNELARHGLSVGYVAQITPYEKDRWNDLKRLNSRLERLLALHSQKDHASLLLDGAIKPSTLCRLTRPGHKLVLACVPELFSPMKKHIQSLEQQGASVEIWVHAPADRRNEFDEWGCPVKKLWNERTINIRHEDIVSAANPEQLAQKTLSLIARATAPGSVPDIGLGVCDSSFFPSLNTALLTKGWKLHERADRLFRQSPLYKLLSAIERCVEYQGDSWPLEMLMNDKLLSDSLGIGNQADCCIALDKIRQEHIPDRESYLLSLIAGHPEPIRKSFNKLVYWRDRVLEAGNMGKALAKWSEKLQGIADEGLIEDVNLFHDYACGLMNVQNNSDSFDSPTDAIHLLAQSIAAAAIGSERGQEDLDALGWMELQFCRSKHLIITGMHEGVVPEGGVMHQFLPEELKEFLGIDSFESKKARDAYLLTSLVQSHSGEGRSIHIVVARTNSQNDPVTPSSLLLSCSPEDLVGRVELLFNETAEDGGASPVETYDRGGWRYLDAKSGASAMFVTDLFPSFINPWGDRKKSFSPTALKGYLECPFRFWMEQVFFEGRAPVEFEEDKHTMNSRELGTIIHDILCRIVQKLPDASSFADLGGNLDRAMDYASTVLDVVFDKQLGNDLSGYLYQQKQNVANRLERFIALHAEELEQGWENLKCEWDISRTWRGYPIRLKIDRVDINHQQKIIRIIDYKTSKNDPESRHAEASDKEFPFAPILDLPALPKKKGSKKPYRRWIDIQLPLYILIAREELPQYAGYTIQAAYFSVNSNVDEIKVRGWDDLSMTPTPADDDLIMIAARWAEALMEAICEGKGVLSAEEMGFNPPPYSPFEDLYAPGIENIKDVFGLNPSTVNPNPALP